MTAKVDRSVPLALLAGCALIAVAVFFGLRGRAGPEASSRPVAEALPSSMPLVVERSVTESTVRAMLDAQKPIFRERCWEPIVKTTPLPAKSTYRFEVHLDGDGREIARGISETDGARGDVAQCLRLVVAPIAVAPPRQRTVTRVLVELP